MTSPVRLLLGLAVAALAVPLVPFVVWGTRLDHAVAAWLDPPPSPPALAALELAVLTADILLPVPSSLVTTLGGATFGVAAGTLCGWAGLMLGSAAGWALGRIAGRRALDGVDPTVRAALQDGQQGSGPLVVVLTRPLPLVAEAAALLAGAIGMPARTFLVAAAGGNLAIAFAWSLAGALGRAADATQWVLVGSLAIPAVLAGLGLRRRLQPRPPAV